MSVRFDNTGDYLASNGHLPSQTAHSLFMWWKLVNTAAADRMLMTHYGDDNTQYWTIYRDGAGALFFRGGGSQIAHPSAPNWTSWFALYFIIGSGNVTLGWRQEGEGSWHSYSGLSGTFTVTNNDYFRIGNPGQSPDAELRYMRQWDSTLTEADMTNEFNSLTIVNGSALRNLALAAGSSAGTDSSGNGYNMTATNSGGGSLSDGASEPLIQLPNRRLLTLGVG